ncbi:MAG: purine-nucleoside phosphorylase [Elusimicrobia bacterium]|nr:purine-nucleoside phosphorylase [Elusimicrobiota bacterium]
MRPLAKRLSKAVQFLLSAVPQGNPEIAVILGSGLGRFAETLSHSRSVPFEGIPGFVRSTVPGHAGRLVFGRLGNRTLAVLQGRFHFYEGHSMEQITFPCRVLKRLGVKTLILTSAVGGISSRLNPGDFVLVKDHINFMGNNPLFGPYFEEQGERFPDMTQVYPSGLRSLAKKAAHSMGLDLKEGIYCAVRGPCYETPAEIRMFKKFGADVVGMSLVPEAIVATQEGMRVLAVASVSNKAAGLSRKPLNHREVIEAGRRTEASFSALLAKIIQLL